jgi:disulfide bond formation protein DsbB
MKDKNWNLLFICWLLATVSSVGSLFFSEVMRLPPCILCWYQRICIYPLVVIFLMGLFPLDLKVVKFSFPLAIIGWVIALYHNLLYYKILPESSSPCVQGISCTTVQLEWLGFITIPFLAFSAFTLLIILLTVVLRNSQHEK